ncbi:MAG: hypothetical protein HC850_04065 [Rhodomicrobium sp.]|nr:hypothetical protein [Rhodomicrobium sp.]
MIYRIGLFLLAIAFAFSAAAEPVFAKTCKTLKGEFVGFGEQTTKADAEAKLSAEIAAWETRTGLKAQPKGQKTDCKVYIKFLNEFECTAEAVVCR